MIIKDIKALRQISEKVKPKEVKDIIAKLEVELAKHSDGIGLSAIQIGIKKRVGIVRIKDGLALNLINPKIINKYDRMKIEGESCLSLPGLSVITGRYNEIEVENNGERIVLEGLESIVCQHEISHMNGKLMTDYKWKKRK